MAPKNPLPFSDAFLDADSYVDSLLHLVGTHTLLRNLCGGVHILDFFTSEQDLYSRLLPPEWREFFRHHDMMRILDLFMRDDLERSDGQPKEAEVFPDGRSPPTTLVEYIIVIRKHLLLRESNTSQCARNRAVKPAQKLARHVSVGMNIKKIHEVGLFAHYIEQLMVDIKLSHGREFTHLVDFGSGQNYLGRALASEPYNRRIVAIESKPHNAERAKEFDVTAKLAPKAKTLRNKKAFRAGLTETDLPVIPTTLPPDLSSTAQEELDPGLGARDDSVKLSTNDEGCIEYIQHFIRDGDLGTVVDRIGGTTAKTLMVMSLHSCGNLVHHGLRSLVLNPDVKAVAMVGCCYNLLTERLGPTTYKIPELRPIAQYHERLRKTGEACDPHGFPMSRRLCGQGGGGSEGTTLNITARMMAVQAPQNWGDRDSQAFFTRHFYRALLQRIFVDRGVVGPPSSSGAGGSPAGHSSGTPIIIGSLKKSCYSDFVAYVRGAMAKLCGESAEQKWPFEEKMAGISDREIEEYEESYRERKKDLSVVWSLMAFSAGVIEATIVVDRWLWLNEQPSVSDAWVEPIFDYAFSPRNLVVVGVKR